MDGEHTARVKHGHYVGDKPSPEYYSWRSLKARCLNPNHPSHEAYSKIPLHPEWIYDFASFLLEVGPRPSKKHTIDRIKSELGYVPGNVRWATRQTQNRNRADNHWITANGETLCIEDWARHLSCSPQAIRLRIKRGWSEEKAVMIPVNPKLQAHNKKPAMKSTVRKGQVWAYQRTGCPPVIHVVTNIDDDYGESTSVFTKDGTANKSVILSGRGCNGTGLKHMEQGRDDAGTWTLLLDAQDSETLSSPVN